MRRTLPFVVAALALLGLGVGVGILVQRHYQVATVEAVEDFARDLAGLNAPPAPAPAWEELAYPGADLKRSGGGIGMEINGEIVVPNDHHGVWTTADSFEEVIRHYARFLEFDNPESFAERDSTFGGRTHGTVSSESGPATNSHFRDNGSDNSFDPRPVRVECLTRRTRSYAVTVFISRADEDDLTHIIVLYSPWNETAPAIEQEGVSPDSP